MAIKPEYTYTKELCDILSAKSDAYYKQLEEMKEKFPLIALAHDLQIAMIKDLSRFRMSQETEIESIYTSLTREQPHLDDDHASRERVRQLEKCIARASTTDLLSVGDCFKAYGKRKGK